MVSIKFVTVVIHVGQHHEQNLKLGFIDYHNYIVVVYSRVHETTFFVLICHMSCQLATVCSHAAASMVTHGCVAGEDKQEGQEAEAA